MSEPEPKRQRFVYVRVDGPIEDERVAREKMRGAKVGEGPWLGERKVGEMTGFDPDSVMEVKHISARYDGEMFKITAMGYFAQNGDLPMMRWLYSRGACTRDVGVSFWFPMYCAAVHGHLDACRWLHDHGAAQDIKRRTRLIDSDAHGSLTPLRASSMFSNQPCKEMTRWFVMRGALCKDDGSGEVDMGVLRREFGPSSSGLFGDCNARKRGQLLEWANELHQRRSPFHTLMLGSSRPKTHSYPTRKSFSPVRMLGGNPGILALIGDFAGIVRGREARIIRQLTEVLPDFNKDLEEAWHWGIESLAFRR